MSNEEESQPLNGTSVEIPSLSPDLPASKSGFFRTRRKQRTNENQVISIEDAEIPSENTRAIVVPDEIDVISRTNGNILHASLAQRRSSLATSYSTYPRTKSQSVKSIRLGEQSIAPKKAVRFADDFGLNLSQMRFINTDEFPLVPTEAFKHLQLTSTNPSTSNERFKQITYMEPLFENPLYTYGFMDRVHRDKIVLEQANAIDNRIYGTIRLISFGFNKRVKIRLTTNNWLSFDDYDANYIEHSYDGTCDRFSFTIEIDRDRFCLGNNIQFCLSYQSFAGPDYWDNNCGQNYRLNCYSRTIPNFSL